MLWVSVPSGSQVPMGTSPVAIGGRTAPRSGSCACYCTWLRLGCGACFLSCSTPRPRQPSGGHHISSGSNAALPRASTVALSVAITSPKATDLLTAKMVRTETQQTPKPLKQRMILAHFFFGGVAPPKQPRGISSQNGVTGCFAFCCGANTRVRVHVFAPIISNNNFCLVQKFSKK